MIDRLRLLALMNIIDCDCPDCLWQKVDDLMDGLESGDCFATSNGDQMTGVFMSRSGARPLEILQMKKPSSMAGPGGGSENEKRSWPVTFAGSRSRYTRPPFKRPEFARGSRSGQF
jgi:hypothetical protein